MRPPGPPPARPPGPPVGTPQELAHMGPHRHVSVPSTNCAMTPLTPCHAHCPGRAPDCPPWRWRHLSPRESALLSSTLHARRLDFPDRTNTYYTHATRTPTCTGPPASMEPKVNAPCYAQSTPQLSGEARSACPRAGSDTAILSAERASLAT